MANTRPWRSNNQDFLKKMSEKFEKVGRGFYSMARLLPIIFLLSLLVAGCLPSQTPKANSCPAGQILDPVSRVCASAPASG
ncbi:MAG: hypothetical protein WCG27_06345, partial [Pseudomonadota bacterium]